MTTTRLIVILSVGMTVIDAMFNDGRLVDALWGQGVQLGHWLNDELSNLTRQISAFH
jgi:hypothetical protein